MRCARIGQANRSAALFWWILDHALTGLKGNLRAQAISNRLTGSPLG